MNEKDRNIPVEATQKANVSDKMRNVRRQQFIARWGFRAGIIAGLYEVKDTAFDEAVSVLTNFHPNDLRTFIILELSGLAIIASRVINYHYEKQKNAVRINSINKAISKELESYGPEMLPEGYVDQYKDSVNKLIGVARRFKV